MDSNHLNLTFKMPLISSEEPLRSSWIWSTLLSIALLSLSRALYGRYSSFSYTTDQLPIINKRKPWSWSYKAEAQNFTDNANALMEQGHATVGKAFNLQTDTGVHLVLSAEYADKIKNHPNLTFLDLTAWEFHAGIPGFDAWTQVVSKDEILVKSVKENLTNSYHALHTPISEEIAEVIQTNWTDDEEWHDTTLRERCLQIITRASGRALLGPELCRHTTWLGFVESYIVNSYRASHDLHQWPKILRPWVHWLMPSCKDLRANYQECYNIVNPVYEQRKKDQAERLAAGLEPRKYIDGMEWLEQVAEGRPYSPTSAQIIFSVAGIFSSTDTLTQCIFNLSTRPQLVQDLRDELISVMSGKKWEKKTMYNLKLLDSVMKETQRLKPIALASVHRMAIGDVMLPDGLKIPKGTKLMVSAHSSWDEKLYPDAHEFDGYRFLRLRREGMGAAAQFVTTSPSNIGFGHGHLACPGRFFAADEIKIALAHIILKYDFKLAKDSHPVIYQKGFLYGANLTAEVSIRRRKAEIKI